MNTIQWVRTVLGALAFVWVMAAWHSYDGSQRQERARVKSIIEEGCKSYYRDNPQELPSCIMVFTTQGAGVGAQADPSHTQP